MTGRRALVLGGGRAAAFKIRALLHAGASVTLIAPSLSPAVKKLIPTSHAVEHHARKATLGDVRTCYTLIFPLTDDEMLNRKVVESARRKRILVGGVSDINQGDLALAATVQRGPIRLAISTSGTSPMLARLLARRLKTFLKTTFPTHLVLSKTTRMGVRQKYVNPRKRRQILADMARDCLKDK